jgi:hypothetical protein
VRAFIDFESAVDWLWESRDVLDDLNAEDS